MAGPPTDPHGEAIERLRSFLQQTNDAIWCFEFDPPVPLGAAADEQYARFLEGVLVEANVACARKFLAEREDQVLGKSIRELSTATTDDLADAFATFLRQGARLDDFELIEPDDQGRPRTFLLRAHGTVVDGGLRRAWGVSQDVTEEREGAAAMRRNRDIIQSIADPVCLVDDDRRFVIVNPAFAKLYGMTPTDVVGKRVVDVVDEEMLRSVLEPCLSAAMGGRSGRVRSWVRLPDQSRRFFDMGYAGCRGEASAVEGVVIHFRDQTEARAAADQLVRSQNMESLGRLAADVGEELEQVLEMLRRQAGDETTRELARAASVIAASLAELGRGSEAAPAPISPSRAVEAAGTLLGRVADGMPLRFDRRSDWLTRIDDEELELVLVNLLANARDAVGDRGSAVVEVRDVVVDAPGAAHGVPPGAWVTITVRDDGPGMDAVTRESAFEPYFTTKPRSYGVGLGLSAVRVAVSRAHGHVSMESEVGKGTAVTVWLPRVEASVQKPVIGGAGTVLVVEDEPLVREMAVRALERAGFEVFSSGDGQEAFDMAAQLERPLDVLMTDIELPSLSGAELVQRLREAGMTMKVLYASGRGGRALASSLGDPSDPFLLKPYTPARLVDAVRRVVGASVTPGG